MALTGFRQRSGAWPQPSASAKALDYGKQSLPAEGLGQKGRCPILDAFFCSIVERGEHHHGHVREGPILALRGAELPAIHHRHHEVEQNQSWQAFGVAHEVLILDDENLRIHQKQRHRNRDGVRIFSKDRSLKRNVISRLASGYS